MPNFIRSLSDYNTVGMAFHRIVDGVVPIDHPLDAPITNDLDPFRKDD